MLNNITEQIRMTWINRTRRYFILVAVIMATALIVLSYRSTGYVNNSNLKSKGDNNFNQRNTEKFRNLQSWTGKENLEYKPNGNNSTKLYNLNSSKIILSVKEYEDLLSEIQESKKLLMESVGSNAYKNAKQINVGKKKDLYPDEKHTHTEITGFAQKDDSNNKLMYKSRIPQLQNEKLQHEQFLQWKTKDKRKSEKLETKNDEKLQFNKRLENGNARELSDRLSSDLNQKYSSKIEVNFNNFQKSENNQHKTKKFNNKIHLNQFDNFPEHKNELGVETINQDFQKALTTETQLIDINGKGNAWKVNNFRERQRQSQVFNELKKFAIGQDSKFKKMTNGGLDSKDQLHENSLKGRADNDIRKDDCTACFHNNFKYLINQDSLCKQNTDIDLLIVILTAPKEFDARSAIRETWGSLCNSRGTKIGCVFILGLVTEEEIKSRLVHESDQYKDIVQFDFKEAYANLTYKTLSGLRWASEYCQAAKYVMKTDGDMYVNTELLPIMLQAAPKSMFLGGFCWGISSPHRETQSKWYVSFRSYSKSKFPPMCSGTGYIMSMDIVNGILTTSQNIPFFHLEDVYIALCVQKLDVYPVRIPGFNNMREDFSSCHYRNRVITSHYMNPDILREYWNKSRTCKMDYHEPGDLYQTIPFPNVS